MIHVVLDVASVVLQQGTIVALTSGSSHYYINCSWRATYSRSYMMWSGSVGTVVSSMLSEALVPKTQMAYGKEP